MYKTSDNNRKVIITHLIKKLNKQGLNIDYASSFFFHLNKKNDKKNVKIAKI